MKNVKKLFVAMMLIWSLGSTSYAEATFPVGIDLKHVPEGAVNRNSSGGTLLLSDSPEMVSDDGILYQDKVKGDVRLFFYHVNATETSKKMDVLLENKGKETAHVQVSQSSLGGPGYDWLTVGKETLMTYLVGEGGYQIAIPPGGIVPLSTTINETAVLPNRLVNGIFDFTVDQPITVKVMMLPVLEDSVKFSKTARILAPDEYHLRGTFQGANRQLSLVKSYDPVHDGTIGLTLADNKIDTYLTGIDAIDGSKVVNYGNYGVVYEILLPSKIGKKVAYYLVPMGGSYAGAIGIHHPGIKKNPLATPIDRLYFGGEAHKEFAFLGTYDSGDPLSFTFSPPGASNLPVKILLLPQ